MTQEVYLGKVAKWINGVSFKPTDIVEPFSEGSVVCFRTKNVQSNLDENDIWGIPENFVKNKEQFIQEGDILVSTANSWELVGKCTWISKLSYKATLGGFISLLRANPDVIYPRYLYQWFNSPDTQYRTRYLAYISHIKNRIER